MSEAAPARRARVVDAVQYAVGLTVLVSVLSLPVSLLFGLGLWGVKFGLFLVGIFSMGYATVLAWPTSPADLAREGADREETRIQAFVRRFPPATWYPLGPRDRYANWARLYLASLTMFVVSYAMETVFGV